MSMSSMSIESDNGEFDAIATGERSDGGRLGARGTEEKEKGVLDVRVEGMDDDDSFSLRKFAAFVGPGFLMCIAYVDPGNFESNLQAGCQFGYSLLWVLMWATAMGLYIQALSIRLGLATGWHLARVMRDEYPTPARYSLWILTELAIIASDVPEVIGTALALKLIFGLPTVWGVLVTSASTLLFLALQQFGVRKLEAFMGSLVGVMSVCFVAQMAMLEGGDGGEVIQGIVVPIFQNGRALFIGISIIGAVVMPHNLFLHSALVLSRSFELGEKAVRRALKYNVAESALALAVTLVINFAVTIVAAQSIRAAEFDDPTGEKRQSIIDRPLQNAPDMLKDVLGKSAKGLFAAALLASGQSSTITGTYAGQFVMEGFLEIKISPVLRAFLTRTCAILPSLLVTIIAGDEYAEFLIVISSVFLSFQLPYALIPLVKFCGCEKIVGAMAIDPKALQRTWVMVSGIIFANIVLLCVWVHESGAVNGSLGGVFLGLFVAVFMVVYCVSLLALALRPVTQNLTMQVRDRLEGKDFNQLNAGADGGDDEYL